jgi:hypothetical protein
MILISSNKLIKLTIVVLDFIFLVFFYEIDFLTFLYFNIKLLILKLCDFFIVFF